MVKPNAGGIDELLIGIPNAAELYGEHFNLIREQEVNRESIKQKDKNNERGAENSESNKVERDAPVEDATASTQGEETAESTVDVEQPEGQPTESQPEPTADTAIQGETKEAETPAAGELVDEPKKELEKEPESVELTAEEKEAARRKALSEAAKARHAAKKAAAEAEAKKAAE